MATIVGRGQTFLRIASLSYLLLHSRTVTNISHRHATTKWTSPQGYLQMSQQIHANVATVTAYLSPATNSAGFQLPQPICPPVAHVVALVAQTNIVPEEVLTGTPRGGPLRGRRHICLQCGKDFNRPSSLPTHFRTHSDERPFPCPFGDCSRAAKGFSVKSNMQRHCRTVNKSLAPQPTLVGLHIET